jgi:hypothetical protein
MSLKSHLVIGSLIGQGSFGRIFEIEGHPMCVKICRDSSATAAEIRVMKSMEKRRNSKGVTKLLGHGLIVVDNFSDTNPQQ